MAQVPQFINWLTNTPIAIDTSMLLGGTFTQSVTINPATGAASITLNSQQATQQAYVLFQQTGVSKWQLGKQTDDSFFIFDTVGNLSTLSTVTGTGTVIRSGSSTAVNTLFVSDTVAGDSVRIVSQNASSANNSVAGIDIFTGIANAFALLDVNNATANPILNLGWGSGVTQGLNINNNGNSRVLINNGVQVGAPSGGDKGTGTINVQNSVTTVQLFTQAPATLTGSSGSVTSESLIINASVSFTLTLPTASSNTGRWLNIKSIVAQTIGSASSNVVPLASATAGTVILSAGAGKWAHLQSDGSNWVIMAGVT